MMPFRDQRRKQKNLYRYHERITEIKEILQLGEGRPTMFEMLRSDEE